MAGQQSRNDIFTGISIVTLGFMVLGIFVAVLQWREYSREPQVTIRATPSVSNPTLVETEAGAKKAGEEGAAEGDDKAKGGGGKGARDGGDSGKQDGGALGGF